MFKQRERTAVIKTKLGEVHLELDELKKGDVFYLLEPDGKRVPNESWLTANTDAKEGGLEVLWEAE